MRNSNTSPSPSEESSSSSFSMVDVHAPPSLLSAVDSSSSGGDDPGGAAALTSPLSTSSPCNDKQDDMSLSQQQQQQQQASLSPSSCSFSLVDSSSPSPSSSSVDSNSNNNNNDAGVSSPTTFGTDDLVTSPLLLLKGTRSPLSIPPSPEEEEETRIEASPKDAPPSLPVQLQLMMCSSPPNNDSQEEETTSTISPQREQQQAQQQQQQQQQNHRPILAAVPCNVPFLVFSAWANQIHVSTLHLEQHNSKAYGDYSSSSSAVVASSSSPISCNVLGHATLSDDEMASNNEAEVSTIEHLAVSDNAKLVVVATSNGSLHGYEYRGAGGKNLEAITMQENYHNKRNKRGGEESDIFQWLWTLSPEMLLPPQKNGSLEERMMMMIMARIQSLEFQKCCSSGHGGRDDDDNVQILLEMLQSHDSSADDDDKNDTTTTSTDASAAADAARARANIVVVISNANSTRPTITSTTTTTMLYNADNEIIGTSTTSPSPTTTPTTTPATPPPSEHCCDQQQHQQHDDNDKHHDNDKARTPKDCNNNNDNDNNNDVNDDDDDDTLLYKRIDDCIQDLNNTLANNNNNGNDDNNVEATVEEQEIESASFCCHVEQENVVTVATTTSRSNNQCTTSTTTRQRGSGSVDDDDQKDNDTHLHHQQDRDKNHNDDNDKNDTVGSDGNVDFGHHAAVVNDESPSLAKKKNSNQETNDQKNDTAGGTNDVDDNAHATATANNEHDNDDDFTRNTLHILFASLAEACKDEYSVFKNRRNNQNYHHPGDDHATGGEDQSVSLVREILLDAHRFLLARGGGGDGSISSSSSLRKDVVDNVPNQLQQHAASGMDDKLMMTASPDALLAHLLGSEHVAAVLPPPPPQELEEEQLSAVPPLVNRRRPALDEKLLTSPDALLLHLLGGDSSPAAAAASAVDEQLLVNYLSATTITTTSDDCKIPAVPLPADGGMKIHQHHYKYHEKPAAVTPTTTSTFSRQWLNIKPALFSESKCTSVKSFHLGRNQQEQQKQRPNNNKSNNKSSCSKDQQRGYYRGDAEWCHGSSNTSSTSHGQPNCSDTAATSCETNDEDDGGVLRVSTFDQTKWKELQVSFVLAVPMSLKETSLTLAIQDVRPCQSSLSLPKDDEKDYAVPAVPLSQQSSSAASTRNAAAGGAWVNAAATVTAPRQTLSSPVANGCFVLGSNSLIAGSSVQITPRKMLTAFYRQYDPAKQWLVDKLLCKFKGSEDKLFRTISRKYNVDPSIFGLAASSSSTSENTAKANHWNSTAVNTTRTEHTGFVFEPAARSTASLFGESSTASNGNWATSLFRTTDAVSTPIFGTAFHTNSLFATSSSSPSPRQFEAPCSHSSAALFGVPHANTSANSAAGLFGNAQAPLFGESKANNGTAFSKEHVETSGASLQQPISTTRNQGWDNKRKTGSVEGGGMRGVAKPNHDTSTFVNVFGATNTNTTTCTNSAAGLLGNAQLFGESEANNTAPAPAPIFGTAHHTNSNVFRFESEQSPPSKVLGTGFFQATCKLGDWQGGDTKFNFLQSITAMKAYENSSFEELRFQDYTQSSCGGTRSRSSFGFSSASAAPAPAASTTPAASSISAIALFGSSVPAPAAATTAGSSAQQVLGAHGTHRSQPTSRRRRIVKSKPPAYSSAPATATAAAGSSAPQVLGTHRSQSTPSRRRIVKSRRPHALP